MQEDIIAVPISGSLNFSAVFPSNNTSPEPAGVCYDTSKNVVKILLTAVACLGLVTNCMIVIVLTQLRGSHPVGGGERSARFNLLGLAIADFCICLSTLPLIYSKRTYKRSDIMLYYTLFGPGLVSTFLTVSAWMVVLVSILRYLAVCWPLKSRFYLRCRSVICAIVSIYLAAFIFNFPLFLQYDYEEIDPFENETPIIGDVKFVHIVDRIYPHSDLLKDIYNIAHIICTNVGPFIAVLVTNISVIVACKRSEIICENFENAEQLKLTRPQTSSSVSTPNNRHAESSHLQNVFNAQPPSSISQQRIVPRCHNLRPRALHRVTPLLLAVIFAFLLLSTPFGIVQFVCLKLIDKIGHRISENNQLLQQYFILNRLLEWTNFLQVFGCAVNFFLYFMVSQTFRRTTRRTFRRILQRFRRRRGLSHLCAYIFSVCCCEERRSCKNEAYIVRVYSPIECRNHQRHKRPAEPSPLYHERNLLSPHLDLQQQLRPKPESSDSANLATKEAEQIELQMQEGLK
ncbi:Sex peptide receptor [Taenia solium]